MMHYLSYLPVLAALIALGYQIFALLGAIAYFAKSAFLLSKPTGSYTPPVSILKPVRGLDSALHDALLSHMTQDYPDYEILIGVRDMEDPAVPVIRQLITEHPEHPIRLIHCQTDTPNAKVGILIDLARQARHEIILVNDADISVPPQYLRRVAAPLAEPRNEYLAQREIADAEIRQSPINRKLPQTRPEPLIDACRKTARGIAAKSPANRPARRHS